MKPAAPAALAILAAASAAILSCSSSPEEAPPAEEAAPAALEVAVEDTGPRESVDEDPAVEPVLRAMSEALRNAQSLSFRVEAWTDEADDGGVCASSGSESKVLLRRPDRLFVDRTSEKGRRTAHYDGATFSLCDPARGVFARVPARATIDETLDMLHDDYGVVVPLADLVVGDPYAAYTTVAEKALHLGVAPVRGVLCHQIALSTDWLAWQLWVPVEGPPLPRRVEIRYLDEPGAPRFVATLDEWRVDPPTAESDFAFVAPEGCEEIEIRRREADDAMDEGR